MSEDLPIQDDWVPSSCTLPTVERPLRRAEFDALFAAHVVDVVQPSAGLLRLQLTPEAGVAARASDLAVKETGCCSFFTFELAMTGGEVAMVVTTDPSHVEVLDALAKRAESMAGHSR